MYIRERQGTGITNGSGRRGSPLPRIGARAEAKQDAGAAGEIWARTRVVGPATGVGYLVEVNTKREEGVVREREHG
jgi:hypothetical protein